MKYTIAAVILIIAILLSCSPKRTTNVFTDPHFYYDKESYTIIRVNPETREKDIEEYLEMRKHVIPDFKEV